MIEARSTTAAQPHQTEAAAVAAIVQRHVAPTFHQIEQIAAPCALLPDGRPVSYEHLLRTPTRPRAMVLLRDAKSFIAYVNKYREKGTLVLAHVSEKGGSFTAIIDYHAPAVETEPKWGEHVARLECEFTPEWLRWAERSGRLQSQVPFALFIEENMFDLTSPAPAEMLEIVKTLEATQGAKFKSGIRLDNGDREFCYQQQTEGKAGAQGELAIPQQFRLTIPVFRGNKPLPIACRFRWNVDEGQLQLGYEIMQAHKVIETALHETHVEIQAALAMPILLGQATIPKA